MNQHSVFQKRLARVAQQSGHTIATLHIGMDQQVPQGMMLRAKIVGQERARALRGQRQLQRFCAPLSGLVAWVWAHWMRVTLSPAELLIPGFAADLLLALVAIGTLRAIFAMRGKTSFALQLGGLVLGMWLLQALAPLAPELMSAIFSPAWRQAQL